MKCLNEINSLTSQRHSPLKVISLTRMLLLIDGYTLIQKISQKEADSR